MNHWMRVHPAIGQCWTDLDTIIQGNGYSSDFVWTIIEVDGRYALLQCGSRLRIMRLDSNGYPSLEHWIRLEDLPMSEAKP